MKRSNNQGMNNGWSRGEIPRDERQSGRQLYGLRKARNSLEEDDPDIVDIEKNRSARVVHFPSQLDPFPADMAFSSDPLRRQKSQDVVKPVKPAYRRQRSHPEKGTAQSIAKRPTSRRNSFLADGKVSPNGRRSRSNVYENASAGQPGIIRQRSEAEVNADNDLERVLKESKKQKPKKRLICLMTEEELAESRDYARTLVDLSGPGSDFELLQDVLIICRTKQAAVQKAVEDGLKYDSSMVDLDGLINVNAILNEAISTAEGYMQTKNQRRPPEPLPPPIRRPIERDRSSHSSHSSQSFPPQRPPQPQPPLERLPSSHSNKPPSKPKRSLEIDILKQNEDIFSLICMLRAQSEKRLDSALALMQFAREAERKNDDKSRRLRNEIRSSGGLHSLLTLFRAKGPTRELRVVAALAVAYLLPSFSEFSSLSGSKIALKIMECLKFLFSSHPVSPRNQEITKSEMYNACIIGLTTFWMHSLYPMLQLEGASQIEAADTKRRGRGRQVGGYTFNQRQETLEAQELLEMTVSLIVSLAKLKDDEIDNDYSHESSFFRYRLVEQLCAVDVARPLAVREGLLKDLVSWMKSRDRKKVLPAATSLRDLTSTQDKYMAGWIHSQIVSEEGAVRGIVELVFDVEPDVQLAVTQILSGLCVAPHTRAAVVEANCISYLIPLLFDDQPEEVKYAAGSALLQLAAGAMTHSRVFNADRMELDSTVSPDKRDKIISDVVNNGAIEPLVLTVSSGRSKKLRSMAIEVLRVISEDTSAKRETRLTICKLKAAEALGNVLKDDVREVERYATNGHEWNMDKFHQVPLQVVKELHQAICTLANILDISDSSKDSNAGKIRYKGCVQIVKSGGLKSLLTLAFLPFTTESLSIASEDVDAIDLLIEACRLLVALSPLLLSELVAIDGYSACTCEVLHAFTTILKRLSHEEDTDVDIPEVAYELKNDALRGLNALAKSEPLKVLIVDRSLPSLMLAKTSKVDRDDVASTAGNVCTSLGFAEDELAVQIASNDAKLLSDWFCMQRSLLIQAMAREELRLFLVQTWKEAIYEAKRKGKLETKLVRENSTHSAVSLGNDVVDIVAESGIDEFFENIVRDEYSAVTRASVIDQYYQMYKRGESTDRDGGSTDNLLLHRHVYPLNDVKEEKDWILGHHHTMKEETTSGGEKLRYYNMNRVQKLLDSCIPSKLLQNQIVPLFDLRPEASFNFRALNMPERRYFSFRREGQLVQSVCDKQSADGDSEDAHWTLGFTNSSFAGEFSETLVQAMYRCTIIRGLSFTRNSKNSDLEFGRATDNNNQTDEGSGLLANLVGSLPPWVSDLTFDNVLNVHSVIALVKILETMGKLSEGQETTHGSTRMLSAGALPSAVGQTQGSFRFLGIRNSPQLQDRELWRSFINLIGRVGRPKMQPTIRPLGSLRCLDLSGNNLGDEICANLLDVIHARESRCQLKEIDLSRNRIREGVMVTKVFQKYVSNYRNDQLYGVKMSSKRNWKSQLHTLNLSSNELFVGRLAMELIALLKNSALSLKTLDLSNNDLDFEGYVFTDVLIKNTSMRELNLSGNSFDPRMIDSILEGLIHSGHGCGLSFLRFERNSPPLNDSQVRKLDIFEHRSRAVDLDRFISQKEALKNTAITDDTKTLQGGILDNDDDNWDFHEKSEPFGSSISNEHSSSGHSSKGENMITVLFSAPLVFRDDRNKYRPFAKLDFDMERELLWQCLKEASVDIELCFDNATHNRLLAAMTKRCSCLHYSGHGHENYLPLEDGKGGAHWFETKKLKELIDQGGQGGGAPFKFVFVSACHSGLAGETFASAGVPHVVCCKQESELKDTAALAFTRQFYLSLAVGHTVKDSFEQGCKAVRATPNLRNAEQEMKKFVLLPKDGNHDVPVFDARPLPEWPKTQISRHLSKLKSMRGKGLHTKGISRGRSLYFGGARSSELSVRNMLQEDASPSPPQFFMGREVDMFNVLRLILSERLVSVIGSPGVGRSSLVCAICHYINERASTIEKVERIFFVKTKQTRGKDRCRMLILSLINKLVEAGKASQPSQMNDLDIEDLSEHVYTAIKNFKALIVIDRIELLQEDEMRDFLQFLRSVFLETRTVRVMLTARNRLGIPSLGGVTEREYNLVGLSFENTVRLFAHLSPHLHTNVERKEFFNRLMGRDASQVDLKAHHPELTERTKQLLEVLGNGMPADTEKAAYSIPLAEVANLGIRE